MGICRSHPPTIEPELLLPSLNQLTIHNVKPSKYKIEEQAAHPVNQLPQLPEPVTNRLKQLGPFNYEKCDKHLTGKELGPYKFPNGTVYLGQWYNGKPHGKGKYYLPDHSFFQGLSVQGQIEGRIFGYEGFGRIIHPNGDYFEGELKNGLANGKGVYLQRDIAYEGYFRDNLQHGVGFEEGKLYEFRGQFSEGQKVRGRLKLKNKNYEYNGEFKYNKFHGRGILTTQNQKYEGQFYKGSKSGRGKQTQSNGLCYEGQFKNNEKQGTGKVYDERGKLLREQKSENGVIVK